MFKWLINLFRKKHKYTCPCCGNSIKYNRDNIAEVSKITKYNLALAFIYTMLEDVRKSEAENKVPVMWEEVEDTLEYIYYNNIKQLKESPEDNTQSIYTSLLEERTDLLVRQ